MNAVGTYQTQQIEQVQNVPAQELTDGHCRNNDRIIIITTIDLNRCVYNGFRVLLVVEDRDTTNNQMGNMNKRETNQ